MSRVYPLNVPIALYRMFSRDGALLYIGQSVNPAQRFCGHRSDSEKNWITEVATMSLEWYGSREAAKAAEAAAILAEAPAFNVAFQADEPARRRAKKAGRAQMGAS